MSFANLHLHTEYSLLDGACRIKPLMQRLKALGQTACAITDHGVMYGVVEFDIACREAGIHPVIGCEMYVSRDMPDKSGSGRDYSHLILLCENNTGYQNLMYLCSEAFTKGFYYKPRVDYQLLRSHHEGLIALSACLSGDLPRLLLDGRYNDAKKYVLQMQDIFGANNFFIELMDHGLQDEKTVLPRLAALAAEMNVKTVVTNDCHYLEKKDASSQEVLMCIQTGKTLQDETRMRMNTTELYVKSEEEMRARFPDFGDAITRTQEIAERCNVVFDFKTIHLPRFPVPRGCTADTLLRELCEKGFSERYAPDDKAARERLEYELGVITQMGYVDYFLIVWDFIKYAKDHGIMVGPGRGSGAASIVAYCMNITMLDPLKYQLLFERFLNPERVSMPDIDVDFCFERRQEVIDYVGRRYGADHVSQIITFGTMAARGVVRDVGRVLGYSYQETDVIAKLIPMSPGMTLEKAMKQTKELRESYENDERVHQLIEIALTLEGMPRNASTHAAGVLITGEPVVNFVPLQKNDEVITTQFPMGIIEKLGLLKMDFLGLRTLTVIRDTLDMMAKSGVKMRPADIPLDDPEVYAMISSGDTDGVFQLEGGGMRSFLGNMRPENFEDIIAAISLYRPGPMESIPRYIRGKQDPKSVKYKTPLLAPILDVTYGCMVYQEQVMQIVRDLAGYSYGRSDLVRRAMAKKKKDVMARERQFFVHGSEEEHVRGAVNSGVPEDVAESIFDEMTAFASYAFNKAHAACYALVGLQTAWLKKHYTAEFMAALMNSVTGNAVKIASYIHYCRKSGIPILAPHVNKSYRKFTVDTDEKTGAKGIRFGMGGVKNVGFSAVDAIVKEREQNGPYKDIFDFSRRVDTDTVNKRAVESLIFAGCFDNMGARRTQIHAVYEQAMDAASRMRHDNIAGQMSLFDMGQPNAETGTVTEYPDMKEYAWRHMLSMEKDMTGVYISGHPLDEYASILDKLPVNAAYLQDLQEHEDGGLSEDGKKVQMGGIIVEKHHKVTKKGATMGFITLEDLTGQVEGLVFPKVFDRNWPMLEVDSPVLLNGRLSIREDEAPKILVDIAEPLVEIKKDPRSDMQIAHEALYKLFLRMKRSQMDAVGEYLQRFHGNVPVYMTLPDENITLLAPRSWWCDDAEDMRATLMVILPEEDMKIIDKRPNPYADYDKKKD